MTGFSTCTLRAAQVLAILLCFSVPIARCDDGVGEGIDFVLLVDVSRSMMQSSKERGAKHPELILETDGSDPERIRWDAAKLLLDLLGPGDRLMVCRFNHGCPPILNNSGETTDNPQLLRDMEKYDFFKPWSSDFKKSFSWLTDVSRNDLANDINKFNRTDDEIRPKEGQPIVAADGKVFGGIGYLDVGGTRIVSALEKVETWVRARDPGLFSRRPVHVILLTDGLDDEYEKLRNDAGLRNRLRFYTGVSGIAPGEQVPVHCIGLNLKAEDSKANGEDPNQNGKRAGEARDLLKRIAFITGGAFDEVDDSEHLMQFFLCLTKRLRRYWIEEIPFPGGDSLNQPHAKTLVANGLAELSVLSYRRTAQKTPKYAIEPTLSEPKFEWIGPGERKPEAEDVRTGTDGSHYKDGTLYKNGSLYRCYYFGRQLESEGVLGSAPFSKFKDPVTLKIGVPPSETEQRLVLLKGTVQPLFELTSPVAGAQYQRYERLTVRVAMLSKEHFSPRGFQLSATVRPFGERKSDATTDGIGQSGMSCHSAPSGPLEPGQETSQIVHLKSVESGKETFFEGELLLSRLPRGPKPQPIDDYEIQVTAVGLTQPEHALSRTTFELLPRILRVANELLLKPVDPLELSTDQGGDVREFEVEAIGPAGRANPLFGDIPLTLEFIPPQTKIEDKLVPVPLKHFHVTPSGNGPRQLMLKDGRAKVRIALNADLPDRNAKYERGAFVVTHADGVRMEPLRIPVKFRLDLAKVQFQPVPSEIIGKPVEVSSKPITVAIDPNGRVKKSNNPEVTVTLRFLGPAEKSKADPSDFGESEFWLEKVSDTAKTPKRTRTIQVKVGDNDQTGDPFRVHLEPRGDKTPGKYRCRLEVDGDWIDSTTHDFDLNKDAAAIVVAIPNAPLPIGRGLSRQITCKAWLQGLPGETAAVRVDGLRSGEAVLFKRKGENDGGHRFPVVCNPSTPVVLQTLNMADADELAKRSSNLDFGISVPDDTPYGEYSTELTLVGPNVTSKKFEINIVVDGLEFDVLQSPREPNSPEQWQSVSTKPLVQLLRTSMKKTLRVRTGLGKPLEKDEIEIGLEKRFEDVNGDVVNGRLANGKVVIGNVGLSEVRLDDKRLTAEFDVEFPSTTNRNDEGSPYVLKLFARPASVGAPTTKWFVKGIHFEFQVRYLDKKEIVEVRIVPADPGAGK